ncbi:MAG: TonB-dependent receptor [Chitinophagaceae bacterium]|nr:TonB-dependent receptor [Chitinophagaceae bacterium]
MKKYLLLFVAVHFIFRSDAQKDTVSAEKELEEAVVYSMKYPEKQKNLVQKIDVITARQIARFNGQNTGDLLILSGKLFVQKSQQGGSSPNIRGYEASRVLLVIDGIRHNTAIFRAGHLQNVITIDQNMLERVEILYGPSSTLYGSDALGGIVHLQTKSPVLSKTEKTLVTGSAFSRYSTANHEKTIHGDLSIGGKKIAWLSSFTFSDFGDMKMGSRYPSRYPTFGRRDSLIAFFGFRDSVIANKDTRIQKYSGYKQWDVMQKLLFKPSERISHLLNVQYSTSTNIPRYDRLQDKRNFGGAIGTTLRWAQWYYGPQKRLLSAYEFRYKPSSFMEEIKVNINYQDLEESRQQREYRRYDRFDSRRERVKVWGFVIDGRKLWKQHELTAGIDGQFNDVKSRASRTNLNTGAVTKLDTRYPDGKNKMNYMAVFAQHIYKSSDGKWVLNDGLRLQSVTLRSNVIDNSFFNLPVTQYKQDHLALTGNAGIIYNPGRNTSLRFGLSSAFRSPNIDDLVKIFDFSVARRIFVPNADIKPEYTYNADVTIQKTFDGKFMIELTGFYTLFRNAIVPAPFKLNGQDSIIYNGVKSAVFANQNLNKGRTYGFNASTKMDFSRYLSFTSTVTYTRGRIANYDGTEIPQSHIPPLYGKTSLMYEKAKFGTELFVLFNGWKRLKDYNPFGEDNLQYATPDGMPSWMTLNWRGHVNIGKYVQLQAAVENILDRNYRYFASGFSAPGRNFILAVRTKW